MFPNSNRRKPFLLRGSVATHVMIHSTDGRHARVTRDEWTEYQAAKKGRKKLPTIPWEVHHEVLRPQKGWGRVKGSVPNPPRR